MSNNNNETTLKTDEELLLDWLSQAAAWTAFESRGNRCGHQVATGVYSAMTSSPPEYRMLAGIHSASGFSRRSLLLYVPFR